MLLTYIQSRLRFGLSRFQKPFWNLSIKFMFASWIYASRKSYAGMQGYVQC